jgi:hypothetical protein
MGTMHRPAIVVPWVLVMVAIIVVVDILFFRNHMWLRLGVNVAIVLCFGGAYVGLSRRR